MLSSVAHPRVHSGPGSRLRLVCEVSGEPRPALTWYFGETKVSPSPVTGVSLSHSHDKHSLTIERTDITSFGNYSCVARNKLGVFKKHIEVHGRPTEANFLRERSHSGQRSFELAWQVGWGRRNSPGLIFGGRASSQCVSRCRAL